MTGLKDFLLFVFWGALCAFIFIVAAWGLVLGIITLGEWLVYVFRGVLRL